MWPADVIYVDLTIGNPSRLEVNGPAVLVLSLHPDNMKSTQGRAEVNKHVFTVNKLASYWIFLTQPTSDLKIKTVQKLFDGAT